MRWGLLKVLFHSEPATRAENLGFALGLKPVAEVYTALGRLDSLSFIRTRPWFLEILRIPANVTADSGDRDRWRC